LITLSLLIWPWLSSFNWSLSALSLLSNHVFRDFNSKWSIMFFIGFRGPGWLDLTTHKLIQTNTAWGCDRLCKLQKGCTRLTTASDTVFQLLAHGRWFSPASSTTKTGRHDIAKILLKVALNTKNQINQSLDSEIQHGFYDQFFLMLKFQNLIWNHTWDEHVIL